MENLSIANSTMATSNSSFPDIWIDLFQSDQPLDMDALIQSDLFAAKRNAFMKQFIGQTTSSTIAFIASMMLTIHILRSHDGLSTTYHRLIIGLSVTDIVNSFCSGLSSIMAPKEMSYLVPFASGNTATCDAQGFLISFAILSSLCYNCSICFYYSAIITYNKKDDYIRSKLEPWFHGISIIFPLVFSVILLATNAYNGPNGGTCYMDSHAPPHCIGYEAGDIPEGYSIPCWRGGKDDGHAKLRAVSNATGLISGMIIAPVIMVVTMTSMYRSVTKIEKQMQNYGVGALRLRTAPAAPPSDAPQDARRREGFALKMKKLGNYMLCQTTRRRGSSLQKTKSNKMKSQKRAVLNMAFGYAAAYLIVTSSYFVAILSIIILKSVTDTVNLLVLSLAPLQGFFNFIVFMAPKVRTARMTATRGERGNQDQQHTKWLQAFCKAYVSRGPPRKTLVRSDSNRRSRRTSSSRTMTRRISESSRNVIGKMKSSMTSKRIPSRTQANEDTYECIESGRSSTADLPRSIITSSSSPGTDINNSTSLCLSIPPGGGDSMVERRHDNEARNGL